MLTAVTGQPEITRDNLKRMVAVTGRISGRDIGSVIAKLNRHWLVRESCPQGFTTTWAVSMREQQNAFAGLVAVFFGAVALVFLLLLFLSKAFVWPLRCS